MEDISIYILTHKKFAYEENEIYKPLLNGSALLDEDFGYIRDDTGDNISKLNPYYAELTGQYWVWKNSKSDIIGFCHYRRYFKNIFMKKISKEDIENILKNHDIILPHKLHSTKTSLDSIGWGKDLIKLYGESTHMPCHSPEDYKLLRKIIIQKSPEYLDVYDDLMLNSKSSYTWNMYICRKELFDEYCEWCFMLLEEFSKQTDFTKYPEGNKRVLGYIAERLINVFIRKRNLKIKEEFVILEGLRFPIAQIIGYRFPRIQMLFNKILYIEKRIRNK